MRAIAGLQPCYGAMMMDKTGIMNDDVSHTQEDSGFDGRKATRSGSH